MDEQKSKEYEEDVCLKMMAFGTILKTYLMIIRHCTVEDSSCAECFENGPKVSASFPLHTLCLVSAPMYCESIVEGAEKLSGKRLHVMVCQDEAEKKIKVMVYSCCHPKD